MSARRTDQGSEKRSWLPTEPKQILLAVALVLLVAGSAAWIMRYQAQQPKPVPQEKYEAMYRAMYGTAPGPPKAGSANGSTRPSPNGQGAGAGPR